MNTLNGGDYSSLVTLVMPLIYIDTKGITINKDELIINVYPLQISFYF